MGLRFFRRIGIAPGITLNVSKSGPSFSFGPRGMKYTVGPRGTRQTFGIPGTGLSYTTTAGWGRGQARSPSPGSAAAAAAALDLGFFRNMVTPAAERELVAGLKQYLGGDADAAYLVFRGCANLPDSVFMAGFLALGRGLYREAEAAFLQCRGSLAQLGLAIGKYIQGFHLSLEITDYIDAPIDVNERGLTLALAEAFQKQGKFAEAIQYVSALWNADASDVVVCLSLCELIAKNPSASDEELNDVIQMTGPLENEGPIHTNILYLRGAAMYRLKLSNAAVEQLSKALRRKADRPDCLLHQIRYLRGRLYEGQGDSGRAVKDFELIFADNPGFRDVAKRIGRQP